MMRIRISRRPALLAAGATLAVAASLAVSAPGQAATPAAKAPATVTQVNRLTADVQRTVKGSGVAAEAAAVASYWTPARMKAATSLDKQTIKGKAPAPTVTKPQGPAGAVAGAAPQVAAKLTATLAPAALDYPGFPSTHPTAKTVGKVFFSRTYGGSTWNFVCSAAVVNSEGKSTVWTAGHCVYDYANGVSGARVWDSNFTFVPAYANGSAPYGYWYARSMTTMNAWIASRDFTQDNGAAFMNRNFGYRIADYLGAQGLTWNASANFYATAFGYPAASPFNGQWLVRATGNTYASGGTIYMYSGMTGGSSGGPWLRNYDGSYGLINGHNDFVYTSSPNWMYSPYYGNQVGTLYNAVRYQSA